MTKAVTILAAIACGALAGCRSAPFSPPADRPQTVQQTAQPATGSPTKTVLQPANVRSVSFVDETPSEAEEAAAAVPEIPVVPAAAADELPLTLADLEGMALRHNPTLAAAAARMEGAVGRRLQAGLYPNPVIGYHATEIGNQGTAGQQGGFVSQRLITAGKLHLDQAVVASEVDEAHIRLHAQQQRVLSDVRLRFYDALVAQRRLELTTQLADIGDAVVRATETLIEGRLATQNELLQAQIKADESHILFDTARNEKIEAWRRLTAIVGVSEMQMIPLDGDGESDLPVCDWDACYATVMENNRELMAARTQVQRASAVIRRARKEVVPNVDVMLSVRHHNVTRDDVANVQVGVPIPIFDRNQGNIRAAQAEWIVACQDVERIELELLDRLAVAYRRLANARRQVDRYREKMVPRAERSFRLVTDGYEHGQVEYLTLLTSQQTYLQVNLSYLAALRELWTSWALIEGQLLSGSLSVAGG